MKDDVSKVGIFMPTTAVVRAVAAGKNIISSISVRDRLIKSCIANDIKRIIVIVPAAEIKPSHIDHANEKAAIVEYIDETAQVSINEREDIIYLEDGFLFHPALLRDFIHSNAKILKDPVSGKNIFAREDFSGQDRIYSATESFAADPTHFIKINNDNIREARSKLFKWLGKETDGYISKVLNRPLSTFFSRFFADYPIHPAYFTAVTAVIALLMTYVLLFGGEPGILWGCVLFHVASVVDGIDGEIARSKFQTSLRGAKIDTTIDMITNILFMAAMSYALWNIYGNEYLILGIYVVALALLGILLMTSLLYFGPGGGRFDILAQTIRLHFADNPRLLKIFNFCNYFLKRDAFAFIFAVYGVTGLARYIPEFLIFGLVIWNLAIILNAPSILRAKPVASEI